MFFDDFLDDGQTQSGTPGFGGDIRFKNARQQFYRKSWTVIGNGQLRLTTGGFGLDQDTGILPPLQRIFGIAQQVMDDLPQLRRIAEDRRQIGRQMRVDGG